MNQEEHITELIEKMDKIIEESKNLIKETPTIKGKIEITQSLRLIEWMRSYLDKDNIKQEVK